MIFLPDVLAMLCLLHLVNEPWSSYTSELFGLVSRRKDKGAGQSWGHFFLYKLRLAALFPKSSDWGHFFTRAPTGGTFLKSSDWPDFSIRAPTGGPFS